MAAVKQGLTGYVCFYEYIYTSFCDVHAALSLSPSLSLTHILILLGVLGTGETLHMSQQEKSPLWTQSPEETSLV